MPILDLSPAIEAVIKNHEISLISRGFTIKGKPFDSTVFTEWVKKNGEKQRLLFFDAVKSPYKVDVYKLAYLARYMPVTTSSMVKLVEDWPEDLFSQWVSSVESIGICSLGSGPGSDLLGAIYGLLNKENHKKKIRYLIRNESLATWEHFYQSIKKEIVTGPPIANDPFFYNEDSTGKVFNENETLPDVLKNCYDEWICEQSEEWASSVSYSKCNILTLQHVLSDPQTEEDEKVKFDRFGAIKTQLSMIVGYAAKPLQILVSDIADASTQAKIDEVKKMLEKSYKLTVIKSLKKREGHVGYNIPPYLTNLGTFFKYTHYQTIWKIEDGKP